MSNSFKTSQSRLLVILGPTGSGKTALSLRVASEYPAEIVCGDSRTVYKEATIGTAKPSVEEQRMVPHHMLDLLLPSEQYSVAAFQHASNKIISDIKNRNMLPILVGGSGLYIDSVLFSYEFRGGADEDERERLSALSIDELQEIIIKNAYPMPENSQNKRYLVRTIETKGEIPVRSPLRSDAVVVGIDPGKEVLRSRIILRVEQMIASGLIEEVEHLAKVYGWDAPGLQAPAYRAMKAYVEGLATLEESKALFVSLDMQLAKRQLTWFRRNKAIKWFADIEEAHQYIKSQL